MPSRATSADKAPEFPARVVDSHTPPAVVIHLPVAAPDILVHFFLKDGGDPSTLPPSMGLSIAMLHINDVVIVDPPTGRHGSHSTDVVQSVSLEVQSAWAKNRQQIQRAGS